MICDFTILLSDYLASYSVPECLNQMPDDDGGATFVDRLIARNCYKEIGAETEELFAMHFNRVAQECVNLYKWKIETYLSARENLLTRLANITETEDVTDTGTNSQSGTETNTGNETTTQDNTGTHNQTQEGYYNPVAGAASDNLINKTTTTGTDTANNSSGRTNTEEINNTTSGDYNENRTIKRSYMRPFSNNKSNPEIMVLTLEINVVYEDALIYFDKLFMAVL